MNNINEEIEKDLTYLRMKYGDKYDIKIEKKEDKKKPKENLDAIKNLIDKEFQNRNYWN